MNLSESHQRVSEDDPIVATIIACYIRHVDGLVNIGAYSTAARDNVKRALQRFAEFLGDKRMSQCKRFDLTDWYAENPRWVAGDTLKRIRRTIMRCFNWAVEEELIDENPYKGWKGPQIPSNVRRAATVEEYVALMRHGSRSFRRFLFMLRRTGMRPCELCSLTWDQIDFERGVIILVKHKTVTLQRNARPRVIGLDPATLRFLVNLHTQRTKRSSSDLYTLAELIDLYLSHAERVLTKRTFAKYQCYLHAFREEHRGVLLKECTPDHVRLWLDSNVRWQSGLSRSGVVKLIQRPMNWAVDEGLIERNPFGRFSRDLQEWTPSREPDVNHAFLNTMGRPWRRMTLDVHFQGLRDRLGMPADLSAYCFRHLYATAAIEAGVGERQLADQLGHTTTQQVARYAHTYGKISHLRNVASAALARTRTKNTEVLASLKAPPQAAKPLAP